MNALIVPTSARLMVSSSAISITQTPRVSIAASLLPRSDSRSVNQGSLSAFRAEDFLMPCGPSRISTQSALQPGWKIRATAEISQRLPTARA